MRATVIGLWVVLAACNDASGGSRVDDILALEGDPAVGYEVYDAECAVCHGVDGEGGSGPSLAGEDEEREIVEVILTGEDEMPAFDDLADQDIADLLSAIVQGF